MLKHSKSTTSTTHFSLFVLGRCEVNIENWKWGMGTRLKFDVKCVINLGVGSEVAVCTNQKKGFHSYWNNKVFSKILLKKQNMVFKCFKWLGVHILCRD